MSKIMVAIAFVLTICCVKTHAELINDKYPKKYINSVHAEVTLDDATGRLTYSICCTSDESIKIHLKSLDGIEVKFTIAPDVDLGMVALEPLDTIRPDTNLKPKSRRFIAGRERESEYFKQLEREKLRDRTVELKKDEAISRSFYLYDMPWFGDLVAALKKGKFKAYRIDPSPTIYTVDDQGQPIIDHYVEVWDTEIGPDGKRRAVFHTGGIILDLSTVKKIQALKPPEKPEKKGEKE